MKEEFFNKKIDYFFELEYPFINIFLKNIYGDKVRRRYSLIGDGIFNLLYIEDKIYEIKFKEVKKMLPSDGKKAFRDTLKDDIIEKISNQLKENDIEFSVNEGKFITFKIQKYIALIEVIKKTKEPEGLGKTLINGEWV